MLEPELATDDRQIRVAFDAAPFGVHVYQVRGDDLVLVRTNAAAARILGVPERSLDGKTIEEAFPYLVGTPAPDAYRRLCREGGQYSERRRHFARDGITGAYEVFAVGTGRGRVHVFFREVTEQARTEERANEQARLLDLVFEALDELVVIVGEGGTIAGANRAYQEAFGLASRAGQRCYGWTPPPENAHDPAWVSPAQVAQRTGQPCRVRQTRFRADGAARLMDVAALPIPGARLGEVLEIARDVSDQVALERHAQQAQKLEAMGTLAGGIAHEFNNLLFGIMGYAELLRMDVAADSLAARNIAQILKLSERARGVVERVQAFSRDAEPRLVETDLLPLVRRLHRLLEVGLPPSVTVRVAALTPATVLGDSNQITQAVLNLVANAVDAVAGSGGGAIELSLRTIDVDEGFARAHLGLRPGAFAVLTVGDTGRGIDAAHLDRVFEPFFTTRPTTGSGLGLSVAHGIVTAHGGTIAAFSEPGFGSTFHVYLPRLAARDETSASASAFASGGTERILLVQRDAHEAEMLRDGLARLGYRVVARSGAAEAEAAFRAAPHEFDIAVLDSVLPGADGTTLAERFRALDPSLPVLLTAGFARAVDGRTPAVADGVIAKPLASADLDQAIRTTLARRLAPPGATRG